MLFVLSCKKLRMLLSLGVGWPGPLQGLNNLKISLLGDFKSVLISVLVISLFFFTYLLLIQSREIVAFYERVHFFQVVHFISI